MKFYTKAIQYASDNLGKVPYEELKNRLDTARLMDEFMESLRELVGEDEAV